MSDGHERTRGADAHDTDVYTSFTKKHAFLRYVYTRVTHVRAYASRAATHVRIEARKAFQLNLRINGRLIILSSRDIAEYIVVIIKKNLVYAKDLVDRVQ